MKYTRMAFFTFIILLSRSSFSAARQKKTVFKNKFDQRFISSQVQSYASHRRLCGTNKQLGWDTFEYSMVCCEEKDNRCVSQKNCRTPVASCIFERSDGSTEVYKSRGLKECGQCQAVDDLDPEEIVTPYWARKTYTYLFSNPFFISNSVKKFLLTIGARHEKVLFSFFAEFCFNFTLFLFEGFSNYGHWHCCRFWSLISYQAPVSVWYIWSLFW